MKHRIKIYAILVGVLMVISIPWVTVVATEVPITGTEVAYCNVTFEVVDESGQYKDPIEVTLTDIAAGKAYAYKLTYDNSYGTGNEPVLVVQANTTYKISLTLVGGYSVVNQDGTAIEKFGATESGHAFKWKICAPQSNAESGVSEVAQTPEVFEGTAEEGDALFKKSYEVMKRMQDHSDWESKVRILGVYAEQDMEDYVKYVQGTPEEWENMSDFDKYIYINTYMLLAKNLASGNYTEYFGDESNYSENTLDIPLFGLRKYDEQIQQAYKELMAWQYNYIQKNHSPYNFFTGKSYLDTIGAVPDSEAIATERLEAEQKEIEEAMGEILEDKEVAAEIEQVIEEETKEKGIWDDVIQGLKDNIVSIIILIIGLLVIGGIMFYRKKINYSDMD